MNNKKSICLVIALVLQYLSVVIEAHPILIVTTTAELADITKAIGKEDVTVVPLVVKNWDVHHVEPKPSMVVAVRKADMLIRNGMSLDIWLDNVLVTARNERVMQNASGYIDVSIGIKKLEVISGPINKSMGDVHRQGNPHYMLDPRNVLIVSKTIKEALIKHDPSHASHYQKNYDDFIKNYSIKIVSWNEQIKQLKGKKAITYHKTWVYFFKYASISLEGTLEPVPGSPPTPIHLSKISERLKKGDINYIVLAHYNSDKEAKILAKKTTVPLVYLPTSVEVGSKEFGTYIQMIQSLINQLGK